MPPSDVVVSVAQLREAARLFVEEVGLRDAAAAIGLSFSGLRTFLGGTSPHPRTLQKLRVWYALGKHPERERTRAALMILLGHLPEEKRSLVIQELAQRVEQESRAAEVEVPNWVSDVRRA
jgi:hypothetical protein